MKVNIYIGAALIFLSTGFHSPDQGRSSSFPPDADPERVGKLLTENLLSRDYMLRADNPAIHYAEICTADGAINFTRQIRDTSLFLQLEQRYECFLEKENCELIFPKNSERNFKFQAALVELGMYNWTHEKKYFDCVLDFMQDRWDRWADPEQNSEILMFSTRRTIFCQNPGNGLS